MAKNSEKTELHKTIWDIANKLRGSIDGWSFKSYVLGSIFYRYISENITNYINDLQKDAGVKGFDYTTMSDGEAESARDTLVEEKGYFILPSQLFCNVVARCEKDENLNETLNSVFRAIEASAQGSEAENDLKGLFSDFIVDSSLLGNSVNARNVLLAKVLMAVRDMKLDNDYDTRDIDVFGDAYEFLMTMYASKAGKSGGEFFTPQEVSELIAQLAASGQKDRIKTVYDPACGSGSLLLKFAKMLGDRRNEIRYYGQEVNPTTYNLCRINMFLHNINYSNFDIRLGDTLKTPMHLDDMPFDAIVSNPPYSIEWDGKDNPILINDERYAPAGVLAPKSKADLAFAMHMLYHLAETGTAAIVEFPGVLYRGGDEQKIRKYLMENNFVDCVIQLPANLFFGVSIATCIIVLKKNKATANVVFIDGSNEYVKDGNKNKLTSDNQQRILDAFAGRKDVQYFCKVVDNDDILGNGCNLSVSSYVEQKDIREKVDIVELNARIEQIVAHENELRTQINAIIKSL